MSVVVTKDDVLAVLSRVYDPEVPLSIVDLGLVYDVEVTGKNVKIKMTLTAPGCPLRYFIIDLVKEAVKRELPEVENVEVELVWDPPWTPERMSEKARKMLGL